MQIMTFIDIRKTRRLATRWTRFAAGLFKPMNDRPWPGMLMFRPQTLPPSPLPSVTLRRVP